MVVGDKEKIFTSITSILSCPSSWLPISEACFDD
uniref:Uncharacterized protein n=1 Tax=Anguilla anguilla TaxID=7936 RepID=A0A0E9VH29_ANGAN